MQLVPASEDLLEAWTGLRNRLWPDELDAHRREALGILSRGSEAAFLLVDDAGVAQGFIEGQLYASADTRYGHVEGWYVVPAQRGQGHGRALLERLEAWFLHHSIGCFHSDTVDKDYPLSRRAHERAGFEEAYTIRVFIKKPLAE